MSDSGGSVGAVSEVVCSGGGSAVAAAVFLHFKKTTGC